MAMPSRLLGHWDDTLDDGPVKEPSTIVGGHKVYRKESCTLDHRVRRADGGIAHSVPARRYFGLWQCGCCGGVIAPSLRRKVRTITLGKFTHGMTESGTYVALGTNGHKNGNRNGHSSGNGNGHKEAA